MRILLLNQCFQPDYVATAQHLSELALGLVKAGHSVTAVASSRGYDNPDLRYPVRETWHGIEIHRIWTPGLGKRSKWRRLVDFATFWLNATLILLRLPRFDVTVCLTSPPLISSLGTLMAVLKGGAVVPWVMDLNPDEAVAAGWLRAGCLPERVMTALQNWSFGRAARIIALDRFMAARLVDKGVRPEVIHVDAPWAHDDAVRYDAAARATFRDAHGIQDKFVVMYSGNHSPCHPLDTLMLAALALRTDARLHFLFIGGGSEHAKVKHFAAEHGLANVTCLPYLPLHQLSGSLSAADLHVVAMGAPFIGMVHPCKIYNILTLGLPWLALAPTDCHLGDLVEQIKDGRYATQVNHGDHERIKQRLTEAVDRGHLSPSDELQALGAAFSMSTLRPRLIHAVEEATVAQR